MPGKLKAITILLFLFVSEYTLLWILQVLVIGDANAGDKKPHFTIEPPARLLWPATKGAYASCRATGHPPPDVHWVTAEGQLLTTIPSLR